MYSKHARNDIVQMWHGFTDSPKQSSARSSIQRTVHEWYVPFSYQWVSLKCTPVNEYISPGDRSLSLQCTVHVHVRTQYTGTHRYIHTVSSMKIYTCVAMFIRMWYEHDFTQGSLLCCDNWQVYAVDEGRNVLQYTSCIYVLHV